MLGLKSEKQPIEGTVAPFLPQRSAHFLFWVLRKEWVQGKGTRRKDEVSENLRISPSQPTKLSEHI